MIDHLARGGAGVGEAEVINHVVETHLEDLQHGLAGDAAALERAFVNVAKLAFHQTIVVTQLLLFEQTERVVGHFAAGFRPVHARSVISSFEVFRGAEDGCAEPAADAGARSCVTSHKLNAECGARIAEGRRDVRCVRFAHELET